MRRIALIILVIIGIFFTSNLFINVFWAGIQKVDAVTKATQSSSGSGRTNTGNSNSKPNHDYSQLEISKVSFDSGKASIQGITDLPEDSMLNVTIAPIQFMSAPVSRKTEVRNGKFVASLAIPNNPEYSQGIYLVDVIFDPRRQSPTVNDWIPSDGKNLTGKNAVTDGSETLLKASQQVELSIPIVEQSATTPPTGQIDAKTIKQLKKVFSGVDSFTQYNDVQPEPTGDIVILETYQAVLGGKTAGYVFKVSSPGYSDPIVTLIGISIISNKMIGILILEQNETPSLGDGITKPAFLIQFLNKSINDPFEVGNDIKAVSSATISSSAVTKVCQEVVNFLKTIQAGKASD